MGSRFVWHCRTGVYDCLKTAIDSVTIFWRGVLGGIEQVGFALGAMVPPDDDYTSSSCSPRHDKTMGNNQTTTMAQDFRNYTPWGICLNLHP